MTNTTTCFICHKDFADRDMLPLPVEGEACQSCIMRFAENYCRAAIKNAAAAPDLLAAVRDCRRLLASGERVDDAVIEQIDEIIKRATGE
jgi:hypothetical protein